MAKDNTIGGMLFDEDENGATDTSKPTGHKLRGQSEQAVLQRTKREQLERKAEVARQEAARIAKLKGPPR